jgi:hypothetical protein
MILRQSENCISNPFNDRTLYEWFLIDNVNDIKYIKKYYFYVKDEELVRQICKDRNLALLNMHSEDIDIKNFCKDILKENDCNIEIEGLNDRKRKD